MTKNDSDAGFLSRVQRLVMGSQELGGRGGCWGLCLKGQKQEQGSGEEQSRTPPPPPRASLQNELSLLLLWKVSITSHRLADGAALMGGGEGGGGVPVCSSSLFQASTISPCFASVRSPQSLCLSSVRLSSSSCVWTHTSAL